MSIKEVSGKKPLKLVGVASSLASNPLYLLHNGFLRNKTGMSFGANKRRKSIITQSSDNKPTKSLEMLFHYSVLVVVVVIPQPSNCLLEKLALKSCIQFFQVLLQGKRYSFH